MRLRISVTLNLWFAGDDFDVIYDITRSVNANTAVWQGDASFSFVQALAIAQESAVNLTTITMSPHTGTHADAYFHYERDGEHPSQMPLDAYIGRAQVVTVAKRDGALMPADFAHVDLAGCERLLVHSAVSELPDSDFPKAFPFLSIELIEWLAGMQVRLIGLDSPSVDAVDSKELPCHHALRKHNMVNLENVWLRHVPDGAYELIALPLKLDGVCGSPVRAILRPLTN
jgi:arylformamidase